MNKTLILSAILLPVLVACGEAPTEDMGAAMETEDYERGPNNGRMLRDGDFAIELAIVEAGVPPGVPCLGHRWQPGCGSPRRESERHADPPGKPYR